MTDRLAINEAGDIISQPLTWDGEPLWSPATVREGLFDAEAFEQMPGQMAMDGPRCKKCGGLAVLPVGTPDMCEECDSAAWQHIAELNADRPGVPGNDRTNVWD